MDLGQTRSPFVVAELLQAILRLVDHPKTLGRCARVNREWYNLSTPLLWRGYYDYFSVWRGLYDYHSPWLTPDIGHLVKLAKYPDRFRHYTSFIDTLVLRHNPTDRCYRQDLHAESLFQPDSNLWSNFTGSSVVVVLLSHGFDLNLLRVLIQPALQSLSLLYGNYKDEFLQYLNRTCTLRFLELHNPTHGFTSSTQTLQSCVQQNPLEHLSLTGFENLVGVNVGEWVFKSQTVHGTASTLRSLHLQLYSPVLKHLFQLLPNLESFKVIAEADDHTWNISQELLRPITVCSQLRELSVVYLDDHNTFTFADFHYFAQNCHLIELLKLGNSVEEQAVLSSNQLLTAVSLWPNLQTLIVDTEVSTVTHMEISIIAKSCLKLECLELNAPVAANAFDGKDVLFPALENISFGGILCDPWPTSHEERVIRTMIFKAAIMESMPRLAGLRSPTTHLYSTNNPNFHRAVIPDDNEPPSRMDDSISKAIWREPMSLREEIRLRIMQRQN